MVFVKCKQMNRLVYCAVLPPQRYWQNKEQTWSWSAVPWWSLTRQSCSAWYRPVYSVDFASHYMHWSSGDFCVICNLTGCYTRLSQNVASLWATDWLFAVLFVYAPENFSRVCVGMLVCEWKVWKKHAHCLKAFLRLMNEWAVYECFVWKLVIPVRCAGHERDVRNWTPRISATQVLSLIPSCLSSKMCDGSVDKRRSYRSCWWK